MSSADGWSRRREGCRAHVHHAVLRSGHEGACAAACRPRLIRPQLDHARAYWAMGHGHRGQLIQCALLHCRHEGVSAAVLHPGLVRLVGPCADEPDDYAHAAVSLFSFFVCQTIWVGGDWCRGGMPVMFTGVTVMIRPEPDVTATYVSVQCCKSTSHDVCICFLRAAVLQAAVLWQVIYPTLGQHVRLITSRTS